MSNDDMRFGGDPVMNSTKARSYLRPSQRLPRAASCGAEQKSIRKINHPNKPKHGRQALRHLFDAILSRMILIVTSKRAWGSQPV